MALLLVGAGESLAEDWPQWRGPSGEGTTLEKKLPPSTERGLEVRWKTALRGDGCSSPIVSQGRVYVTTAYENEAPHPWDGAAALVVFVLAGVAAGLALVRLPGRLRALIDGANSKRQGIGLSVLTLSVITLIALILAKPKWFWQFADPWTGTMLADAELPFVEWFYLRPIIALLTGSLVWVFVRLVQQGRGEGRAALSRWMAVVTAYTTTAAALAAGLVGWRPDWFWNPGQPWLVWLVTGGLMLFSLAAGIGWLAERGGRGCGCAWPPSASSSPAGCTRTRRAISSPRCSICAHRRLSACLVVLLLVGHGTRSSCWHGGSIAGRRARVQPGAARCC